MSLVTKEEQERISAAIRAAEEKTNAELVTVIARASDDYRYIPLLWASLIALVSPALVIQTALYDADPLLLFGLQMLTFVVLALVFSLPGLRARLIPRGVKEWRAANMAHRQFLDLGLHHTSGETGLLIFLSEAEHFVEILADRGISGEVDNAEWSDIVREFIDAVHADQVEKGLTHAIERCGEILARAVPKTEDNHNELDDRLVLIGYD